MELREQIKSEGIENVHIYGVAGRSLCGLILGAKNLGLDWKFTGVMVTDDPDLDRYIFNNAEFGAIGDWKNILPGFLDTLKDLVKE